MKIFISADIEGSIGVLDGGECRHGSTEYELARRYMTREVIAASEGAIEAGATEVVIKDAHGTGRNILIDDLPEEVSLVRGWSAHPFKMMQELDATYDGVIFTGYHSGARCGGNNLAHTINGGVIKSIRLNGELVSEYLINSYTASYVGVPVIFLSGDENQVREVESKGLGIETLAVKRGEGGSIVGMSLEKGCKAIRKGVEKAVGELKTIKKIHLPEEFHLEIEYQREEQAVRGSYYPGMKRAGAYTIEGRFEDYFDLLRALLFLTRD